MDQKISIKIVAFGIAKEILANQHINFDIENEASIAKLKTALLQQFPKFNTLSKISFAVNEAYVSDDYILKANDEVIIIPPVSGG